MKIIIGLGNPGKKYEHTRHNAGWRVLDALASELGLEFAFEKKFNADIAKNDKIILVKPQTFMNNSGQSASSLATSYKLQANSYLLVHDEIDLPFGKIRLSPPGTSPAGHNGVKSVLEQLANEFSRLRIGIDGRINREQISTEDFVLQNFTPEEEQELKSKIIPEAIIEIKKLLNLGF